MKHLYLLFLLACVQVNAQTNFNMESWSALLGSSNPTGWISANFLTSNTCVIKDSVDRKQGSYSARIQTVVLPTNPAPTVIPDTSGLLLTASVSFIPTLVIKQGFASTQRYDTLGFWAKVMPVGNDFGFVYVTQSKWNAMGTNDRDTLMSGTQNITSTSWDYYRVKLVDIGSANGIPSTTAPDTSLIVASSSPRNGAEVGSKLWVDDFQWNPPVGTGLAGSIKPAAIRAFPIPASDRLRISGPEWHLVNEILITDATGKVVFMSSEKPEPEIELSALPNGFYNLIVRGEDGKMLLASRIPVCR